MKKKKVSKPRKPRLKGWDCFIDTIWDSGPGVIHKKSGKWLWFFVVKPVKAVSK